MHSRSPGPDDAGAAPGGAGAGDPDRTLSRRRLFQGAVGVAAVGTAGGWLLSDLTKRSGSTASPPSPSSAAPTAVPRGYRLFPTTSGPSRPNMEGSSSLAGVAFEVTTGGCWLDGYWWWVCNTGQPTAAQKFALWSMYGGGVGSLVSGSVVTSGALTAGQWNYVPLPAPLPLAIGTQYVAATGFTGSFPITNGQYGSGGPYSAGITSGPLFAYSDGSGSAPAPYTAQGTFGTQGSDPTVSVPTGGSGSSNFWMDVQVSSAAPSGYSGSYRLWPNKFDASPTTGPDSPVNYVVATEVHLSTSCSLNAIWYYSPSGTSQLATECGVWDISTRKLVAGTSSPTWSGAAGKGWVSCSFSGVTLPPGMYRVAVYNGAATPDEWSSNQLHYWDVGVGKNGITNGPVSAPSLAEASDATIYQGSITEPGQSVFAVGPPNAYPNLYVDKLAQNYWVDMEVTPVG